MTSMFGLARPRINLRRAGLFILTACLVGSMGYFIIAAKKQTNPKTDEATSRAIKMLWSADESERELGKNTLLQMGLPAVRPLMALLEELIRHPGARYAEGKNERDSVNLREKLDRLPPSSVRERAETIRSLSNITIDWRLRNDCCELLGLLKSELPIPILIEAMEDEDSTGSGESMNPAMLALVQIGSAAVPRLITSIETAKQRAAAAPFPEGEHPSDFFVRTETAKYQARAAMVLGKIGDARGLPVLEELQRSTDDEVLVPYITEAIEAIRQKKQAA